MMPKRHYHEPRDNGGALIRPMRSTRGVYELDTETKTTAREFIKRHSGYYQIPARELPELFEMLGIVDDETPEETP